MQVSDNFRWDNIHQKTHQPDELYSQWAEEKEKEFPKASLIVDIGGGTGSDALYFLEKGHSVVLLDISEFALKAAVNKVKAKGLLSKFVTKQCDYGLNAFPVKDDSADIVYARISLNYFDKEHTIRLFRDIYRIIKPAGSAHLSFKSPEDKEEMEYLNKMTVLYEPNVYIENGMLRSRFTLDQLKQMLVEASIKDFVVKPFSEELGIRRQGHRQTLYLNEVSFKKEK